MLIDNDEVAAVVATHPGRFVGVAARAVNDLGFVAVRVVPWLWNLPPNDRDYYPLYAECVDLGIPFCTQIGHTGPLYPSEPGRPIPYPDDVLLEFPERVVVGNHVSCQWIDEVISLATEYPNRHLGVRRQPPTHRLDRLRAGERPHARPLRNQLADAVQRPVPSTPLRAGT